MAEILGARKKITRWLLSHHVRAPPIYIYTYDCQLGVLAPRLTQGQLVRSALLYSEVE